MLLFLLCNFYPFFPYLKGDFDKFSQIFICVFWVGRGQSVVFLGAKVKVDVLSELDFLARHVHLGALHQRFTKRLLKCTRSNMPNV